MAAKSTQSKVNFDIVSKNKLVVKITDISFLFHLFFQDAFYNCDIFHNQ